MLSTSVTESGARLLFGRDRSRGVARPILDTLTLALTVALAAPVVIAGAEALAAGDRLLGGVLLGLAALMLVVEEFVLSPTDLPKAALQRVVGAAVKEPEDDDAE
jgi:hypothetical protein